MAMNKTQLVARATELGLTVDSKVTKEALLEQISEHLEEAGDQTVLVAFLNENGFTIDKEGNVVKLSRKRTLGENPTTKAHATIEVLQDESLESLSYTELSAYLKETKGVETTSNSISWYANWMKQRGMAVVPRKKAVKEKPVKEAAESPADTDEV